ncbi:glutathione S-transferase family protein [Litorimonas sp. WD9-15]|uniref:glutathione S-transferase family protein n=1 Tax=Litorimonas sp. WD9-15 TaxID=3418716 RepID=UPI003CFCE33B
MSEIKNLTLHHYPLSRSARVKWLLHEMRGEDFEVHRVALRQGGQYTPEYLAKNPNHAVPVLEVTYADGSEQVIFESMAILTWLADLDDRFAPKPSDLKARADYLQILALGGSWMDQMLWNIRLHENILPKAARNAAFAQFNRDKIENEITPQLVARLSENAFICGETFTAADCLTGQNLNWARAYGLCANPVLKDYMKRMKSRPAFQLAFADAKDFEG